MQARRAAKWLAIRGGLESVSLATAARLVSPRNSKGVIFTMHHVQPERKKSFSPNAHLSITPDFLDKTIRILLANGWTPIHLEDMPQRLENPDDNGRYMAFTLDDGYRDNRDQAYPVFKQHNIPFTVFITSGFVDRARTIWWETLEQMLATSDSVTINLCNGDKTFQTISKLEKYAAFDDISARFTEIDENHFVAGIDNAARRAGIDPVGIVDREILNEDELRAFCGDPLVRLGAHTVNHINLARAHVDLVADEIGRSADFVEKVTGARPQSFAFPYGDSAAACRREFEKTADLGFSVAVTTRPGLLQPVNAQTPTAMPRVSLNGYHQNTRYVNALLSGLPFRLASASAIG
jgi:peptidoglycan/xylan/chitin deacetylase (PgdA/CDA1 family)